MHRARAPPCWTRALQLELFSTQMFIKMVTPMATISGIGAWSNRMMAAIGEDGSAGMSQVSSSGESSLGVEDPVGVVVGLDFVGVDGVAEVEG